MVLYIYVTRHLFSSTESRADDEERQRTERRPEADVVAVLEQRNVVVRDRQQ